MATDLFHTDQHTKLLSPLYSETDNTKLPVTEPPGEGTPPTMIVYSSPNTLSHDTRELKPVHTGPSSFAATHWKPQEVKTEITVSKSADPPSPLLLHVEAVNMFPVPITRKNLVGSN